MFWHGSEVLTRRAACISSLARWLAACEPHRLGRLKTIEKKCGNNWILMEFVFWRFYCFSLMFINSQNITPSKEWHFYKNKLHNWNLKNMILYRNWPKFDLCSKFVFFTFFVVCKSQFGLPAILVESSTTYHSHCCKSRKICYHRCWWSCPGCICFSQDRSMYHLFELRKTGRLLKSIDKNTLITIRIHRICMKYLLKRIRIVIKFVVLNPAMSPKPLLEEINPT